MRTLKGQQAVQECFRMLHVDDPFRFILQDFREDIPVELYHTAGIPARAKRGHIRRRQQSFIEHRA